MLKLRRYFVIKSYTAAEVKRLLGIPIYESLLGIQIYKFPHRIMVSTKDEGCGGDYNRAIQSISVKTFIESSFGTAFASEYTLDEINMYSNDIYEFVFEHHHPCFLERIINLILRRS